MRYDAFEEIARIVTATRRGSSAWESTRRQIGLPGEAEDRAVVSSSLTLGTYMHAKGR